MNAEIIGTNEDNEAKETFTVNFSTLLYFFLVTHLPFFSSQNFTIFLIQIPQNLHNSFCKILAYRHTRINSLLIIRLFYPN